MGQAFRQGSQGSQDLNARLTFEVFGQRVKVNPLVASKVVELNPILVTLLMLDRLPLIAVGQMDMDIAT